jgi:hypothetical protein
VAKRYHPPQTPCERLLQAESIPIATKRTLREIAADLDPLKLLEETRAVQAHLAALANSETPPPAISEPPNLAAFVASLSSAWHAGEIRSPSRPNHGICGAYKKAQLRSSSRVPPRRPRRRPHQLL